MIRLILIALVVMFVVRALLRRRKPPELLTEVHPVEPVKEDRQSLRSGEP